MDGNGVSSEGDRPEVGGPAAAGGGDAERRARSLELLGGFALRDADGASIHVSSEDARLLLALLAVHRDKPLTRVQIVGMLWPDHAETRGRKWLSQAIWRLNQDIDGRIASPILATSTQIEFLASAVDHLDVSTVEQSFAEAQRQWSDGTATVNGVVEMLQSWGGALMEGHGGEWVEQWRRRFDEMQLTALTWLVQTHRRSGDLTSALRWARRRIEIEPDLEAHHREVVRLLVVLDRTEEARAHIVQFEERTGGPASEDMLGLVAGMKSADEYAPSSTVVGRHDERAALVAQLEEVSVGRGGLVVLEGEPGSGKTLLLEELAARARQRQLQVLWVEHSRRSRERPFAALASALSSALDGVRGEHVAEMVEPLWMELAAHLVPSVRAAGHVPTPDHGLDPADEQWRRREALCRLMLAVGALTPTVVVVDDLHWADDATVAVLQQIANRLGESGVLVVTALRSSEVRPDVDLSALLDGDHVKGSLELEGMSAGEVAELAVVTGAWNPGDRLGSERLLAETGGNPFFVVETLRARAKLDPQGLASTDSFPVASSVSSLLGAAFKELSDEGRAVLSALSVTGRGSSITDLTALTMLGVESIRSGLDEAVDARLVLADEGRFRLRHHQIGRVVRSLIDDDARAHYHDRAVDLLAGGPAPLWSDVAGHAELCGRWADAVDALDRSAETNVAMGATRLAIEHLERALAALERLEDDDARRFGLLMRLERQYDVVGERDRQHDSLDRADLSASDERDRVQLVHRRAMLLAAESEFDRALELLDSSREANSAVGRSLRGRILHWRGRSAEAVPELDLALDELDAGSDEARGAQSALGSALTEVQEFDTALRVLRDGLSDAVRAHDVRSQVEFNGSMANLFAQTGRADEAEQGYATAIELARSIGYARGEGVNLVNSATLLAMSNRGGRALRLFTDAEASFEAAGNERGLAFVRVNRADLRYWLLGDLDGAVAEARVAASYFRGIGDERHQSTSLDVMANVSRQLGRTTACRRYADRALRHAVRTGDRFLEVQTMRTLGRVELQKKRYAALLATVQPALSLCKELELAAQIPALAALEAQALLGLGQIEEAGELANRTIASVDSGSDLGHLALWWCADVLRRAGADRAAAVATEQAWALLEQNLEGLDRPQRRMALARVDEHRALEGEIRRLRGRRVEVQLPDTFAPFGRPLRADEHLTVRWTVEAPEDFDIESKAERRRVRLMRLLAEADVQGASPAIHHLSQVLGVSRATIKRDLAALRAEGFELVTRGSLV